MRAITRGSHINQSKCRRNIHPQQEVSVTATRRELLGQRGTVGDSAEPDNCCICLSRLAFPVDTNCGHTFCAECILSYWNHDQWPQPARCAVCRSQVIFITTTNVLQYESIT